LDELEKLAAEATPRPWFVHNFADPAVSSDPSAHDVTISCVTPDHITVASMGGGFHGYKSIEQAVADARFIDAVGNAFPELIRLARIGMDAEERIKELQEELTDAKADAERWADAYAEGGFHL
jgi:hypothetical protein